MTIGATTPATGEAVARPSLGQQIRSFGRPFWMANVMELLERLAYYGVRVVIPIYIASTEDPNGLHFTNAQKGVILMGWAIMQSLLPMFTGGFADRYGGKRTISVAIAIKITGYLMMATQRSYGGFFAGCLLLAMGTAIFKPGVQGTLVKGIDKSNSSVGWGIFYQCVNIGGWLGPPLAGKLKLMSWPYVFFSCAIIVSLNYLMLLTYTETPSAPPAPEVSPGEGYRDAKVSEAQGPGPVKVLVDSVAKMFTPRLISFLVIMAGFWLMFMQLFDTLPNFIEEWTDSSAVVAALGLGAGTIAQPTSRGLQITQEWMINLDSGAIIFFMVFVAAATARIKRLTSIVVGIFIAAAGLLLAGATMSGWLCLLGIFVFAVGEMAASPKMNEYLGVIAPKGEEGLYMGYANVPLAIGWGYGAYKGGEVYDRVADKANLATRYLREHGVSMSIPDAVLSGDRATEVQRIGAYLNEHGMGAVATHLSALKLPENAKDHADAVTGFLRLHAMDQLQATLHVNASQATHLLWDAYHPYQVWYGFLAVGLASAVGMVIYSRLAKKWGVDE